MCQRLLHKSRMKEFSLVCREGDGHAANSEGTGNKSSGTDYTRWTGWEDTRTVHPQAEGERVMPADPFASAQLQQQQPLAPYPSLQSPLAIFSSASSSRSSNTLLPAGSISTIKFGAFSPKQSNLMPSPRTTLASPFAGAPLLNRSSTLSSSQASANGQNSVGNGQGNATSDSQGASRVKASEREPASPAIPFQQRISAGDVFVSNDPKLLTSFV